MRSGALVVAPLALAAVLAVSAWGKLRSPSASAQAFRDLRVPAPLRHRVVVEALPWVELALAVLLVVAGGALGVASAVATLGLVVAYLVLVGRALGFEVPVDCACFGEFAPGRITRRTVVRNAWLVGLAVLALWRAAGGGSVASAVADGSAPWGWLAALAAAAVTVWLVVAPLPDDARPGPGRRGGTASTEAAPEPGEADYERRPTPAVQVVLADGSATDLRSLSAQRPQLLLFVSQVCGSCAPVIEAAPRWREQLPALDVRLVLATPPGDSVLTSTAEPMTLHDAPQHVSVSLGFHATPTAVLLGADGQLAGGPVTGSEAVPQFVEEVRAELDAALAGAATDASDASVPADADA